MARELGQEQSLRLIRVRPTHIAPANWTPPLRLNLLADAEIPWTTYAKAMLEFNLLGLLAVNFTFRELRDNPGLEQGFGWVCQQLGVEHTSKTWDIFMTKAVYIFAGVLVGVGLMVMALTSIGLGDYFSDKTLTLVKNPGDPGMEIITAASIITVSNMDLISLLIGILLISNLKKSSLS